MTIAHIKRRKEKRKKERSNTVDSYVNFFLSLSKRNNLDSQSHHVGRNFPLGTYVWPVEHHSIILLPPREWESHSRGGPGGSRIVRPNWYSVSIILRFSAFTLVASCVENFQLEIQIHKRIFVYWVLEREFKVSKYSHIDTKQFLSSNIREFFSIFLVLYYIYTWIPPSPRQCK